MGCVIVLISFPNQETTQPFSSPHIPIFQSSQQSLLLPWSDDRKMHDT